ncbi:hypothetical protein PUN28_020928 [Cardiocondyla obscurior]|uniref:Uncharacterized protein n=1 Tax=Cardiocondyla obscurior TaxID=286306 RepID=A0AAW2E6C5_9HYME
MHTGLFRAYHFHQQTRYGRKTKKYFRNLAFKKYAYGFIPSFLFSPADEIWPKNIKTYF